MCRLWWLWTRLVYAVPVLPRPRHGRDRAHGPRADTTTGAGGNDCGGACTPARDSQCLCACAHPHHVVRSIVGGRFTRCKCKPVSAWRVAGWRMGVDGSLRESRDRTKGKRPRKEQRLVTIIYDYRYLGGRKKLTLITELFSTYMELLYRVSRGKTGKRDYRHRRSGERLVDCHGSRLRAYQSPHLRYASRFIVRYLPLRTGSNPRLLHDSVPRLPPSLFAGM